MANYRVVSPGGHELSNGFKPGGDIITAAQVNGAKISKGKGSIILKTVGADGESIQGAPSFAFMSHQVISVP